MTQKEWLLTLATKDYISEKQLETLKQNIYIESWKIRSWINSDTYTFNVTDEGADIMLGDRCFYVDVMKNEFICECGGYYESYDCNDEHIENYEPLRCNRCKNDKWVYVGL